MGRATVLVASVALVAGWGAACGDGGNQATGKAITIKGSDTMVILGQRWAETYMSEHPGARVQVTGGGSGTGIAAPYALSIRYRRHARRQDTRRGESGGPGGASASAVRAGVTELEALVDEREIGQQVACRGVGERRPVRV